MYLNNIFRRFLRSTTSRVTVQLIRVTRDPLRSNFNKRRIPRVTTIRFNGKRRRQIRKHSITTRSNLRTRGGAKRHFSKPNTLMQMTNINTLNIRNRTRFRTTNRRQLGTSNRLTKHVIKIIIHTSGNFSIVRRSNISRNTNTLTNLLAQLRRGLS